jgi:hypothetical protein
MVAGLSAEMLSASSFAAITVKDGDMNHAGRISKPPIVILDIFHGGVGGTG